jgi:hypothetical protein
MTINFNDVTDTATPTSGTFNTGGNANIKGSGTNFVTYSQAFNDASWTKQRTTATADSTTAPDGTTTADTMTGDGTGGGSMSINKTITTTASLAYTISIFAKASTANWLVIQGFDGSTSPRAWFNVSTGVVGIVEAGMSGGAIQSVGDGWYRCSVIRTTGSSSASLRPQYGLGASDGVEATSATTALFLWGAQLEFGSVANTYVPTTTAAIYGTPTLSLSGVGGLGLQSDGSLYVSPAGTGAIQAQATTSTTVGGNARGARAVDLQMERNAAGNVASGPNSFIGGGYANTASSSYSLVAGGFSNTASNVASTVAGGALNVVNQPYSGILSGQQNAVTLNYASVVGGLLNTASGFYGFVGGGTSNSTTSSSAITTQSATMNGTTAVTLSGSNANIKVGQLIAGTSISFPSTYVAAVSGTSLTLSTAATGSSTSTLSFYTPHGIVVGGGNNQATGSYSLIGGGGDAGTAANRNVASGDWSVVAGGARNVASGIAAVISGGGIDSAYNISGNTASGASSAICGGRGHTASGNEATVLGGAACTANGLASVVFGRTSTTRGITGNVVFSGSYSPISGTGSSQTGLLVLARQTTDATATVLTCDSSAAGTQNQVIMPNNAAYYFKGSCIANVTGAANGAAWSFEGAIMRGANAASTVLIDTPSINRVAASAGATTWTIALTADTTNGGLAVTVTGVAATTIRWVAKVETTEVTF